MNAQKHNEPATIAVIAEYDPGFPPHPATNAAIEHSSKQLGISVRGDWISTEGLRVQALSKYDALWIGPGSPYKNMQNTLDAIQYARENGVRVLVLVEGFNTSSLNTPAMFWDTKTPNMQSMTHTPRISSFRRWHVHRLVTK